MLIPMLQRILALTIVWITFLTLSAGAAEELKCETQEHRQLDFWVGEWNVIDQTTGKQVGTSRIEKRLNGCVIFESWTGTDGFLGHSFNMYNRDNKSWEQVWMDSRGQRINFTGDLKADGMHYEGPFRSGEKQVLARMKFLKLPEGQVRQLWEQSADGGKSWQVLFDGRYTQK